jgi:hypothetical protein
MSIFSTLFGSGNQQPAPAPQQQSAPQQPQQQSGAGQPGNIPQQPNQQPAQTAGTAPNGVVPQTATPSAEPSAAPPLDTFSSLWQPEQNPQQVEPLININPKALADAARKTDFTKMISQDQLAAIGAGGEGAMQAFAQAMNSVAQGVYAQSAFAATKIAEQAVERASARFTSEIPNHVKKLQVSESLRSENPALSHPAASPILGAIESQLTMKHPQASSAEIAKMAKQYLENFATAINKPKDDAAAASKVKSEQGTDWTTFLN